jgi:hypothetical protein
MRKVWQQAQADHGDHPTAAQLRKAVQTYRHDDDEPTPAVRPVTVREGRSQATLLQDFLQALADLRRSGLLRVTAERLPSAPTMLTKKERDRLLGTMQAIGEWGDDWAEALAEEVYLGQPLPPNPRPSRSDWAHLRWYLRSTLAPALAEAGLSHLAWDLRQFVYLDPDPEEDADEETEP